MTTTTTPTTSERLDMLDAANPPYRAAVAVARELAAIDAMLTAFLWSPDVTDQATYTATIAEVGELAARAMARRPDANPSDVRMIAHAAGVSLSLCDLAQWGCACGRVHRADAVTVAASRFRTGPAQYVAADDPDGPRFATRREAHAHACNRKESRCGR